MFIIKKLNNILYSGSSKYHTNYYHNCIHKYKKIENYLSLYACLHNGHTQVKTSEVISFNSKIKFGTNLDEVKKLIKAPFRLVKNTSISDIIFFTHKIGSYEIIVEFHFFNKKLFFFKQSFTSTHNKSFIYDNLQKKYLSSNKYLSLDNNIIVDDNTSFLKIENEVYLSVYYLTIKFGFYDFLFKMHKQIENKKLEKENEATKKLYEQI